MKTVRLPAAAARLLVVALVVAAGAYTQCQRTGRDAAPSAIAAAFADRQSGVMVEAAGVVERLLSDDLEGSRHQRFILRVGDQTVLVAHNIDLAPRVPLAVGDSVTLRGQYEWTERGGTVHWTHHDPDGTHPGGWIRYGARTYQ